MSSPHDHGPGAWCILCDVPRPRVVVRSDWSELGNNSRGTGLTETERLKLLRANIDSALENGWTMNLHMAAWLLLAEVEGFPGRLAAAYNEGYRDGLLMKDERLDNS